MSIENMTKITLCEEALDDLSVQTFALEAEIEFLKQREQEIKALKDASKTPFHTGALYSILKTLAERTGRARANLLVIDNNRVFFQSRLQTLLEDSDD